MASSCSTTPHRLIPHHPRQPFTDKKPPESPSKKRLDGLYKDGQWWCSCSPRVKAKLRKVLKDTRNKGRYFWSCPLLPPECPFFLWEDDALLREPPPAQSLIQRPLTSFGYRLVSKPAVDEDKDHGENDVIDDDEFVVIGDRGKTAKEKEVVEEDGEDDKGSPAKKHKTNHHTVFGPSDDAEFSDFGSDEERQLVDLADRSASRDNNLFQGVARTLFPARDPEPANEILPDLGLPTPTKSPSKTKRGLSSSVSDPFPQPLPPTADSPTKGNTEDVDRNIMDLLRHHQHEIPPNLPMQIDHLLSRSSCQRDKIKTERDLARADSWTKDGTIAMLQNRVAVLERSEESLRRQLTNLVAQLINIYQEK
ncbi:hypothetical protein CP533_5780 [Ophiocordyceps camponoti-saundersi (nom. inval.)]|nr:hypothetical protein CP533_5780 [Ophiocordyceps camponoti-saundersi (nom. inval.)]